MAASEGPKSSARIARSSDVGSVFALDVIYCRGEVRIAPRRKERKPDRLLDGGVLDIKANLYNIQPPSNFSF